MPPCSVRRWATGSGSPTRSLWIEVEKDFTVYGEEVKFGGGKVIRDGMGQSQRHASAEVARHGDHQCADHRPLGHCQSRYRPQGWAHCGIGKAGNPDTIRCHHHHRPGHGDYRRRRKDRHRRRHRCPYSFHLSAADRRRLKSGVTTMIGGGTGPATGTKATTCTPGPWHHRIDDRGGRCVSDESRLLRQGQRSASRSRSRNKFEPAPCGLKLHEDWGTTPAAIDNCLAVADSLTCRWRSTPIR